MKPSLERLLEGIMATLRDDVIPHVSDPYARGQAIGVIDLLNNYGARFDWDAGQVAASLDAKRRALAEAEAIAGGRPPAAVAVCAVTPTAEMIAEARALDREISARLLEWMGDGGDRSRAAVARLRRHMHDELREEMKMTKRPMFAEIAKGG